MSESVSGTLIQAYLSGALRKPSARLMVTSDVRPAETTLRSVVDAGIRLGTQLRPLDVGQGDIVAVQLPAWAEWLIAAVATAHAGAVLLPIISIYGAKELGFILRESRAKILVTPDLFRKTDFISVVADCGSLPDLKHHIVIGQVKSGTFAWDELLKCDTPSDPVQAGADDLAMLVYTSGTTAEPKGVRHSHRTLLSEMAIMKAARQQLGEETTLSPWPPGHVAGALSLMRFLIGDTNLILMDQWEPGKAAMLIEKERVNASSFTPFHLNGLIEAADRDKRDLSNLVHCLVGAAPVPGGLITRCAEHGLKTFRSYGSSEHPTVTSGNPDDPLEKRLTTEGRSMSGSEIRFVDEDGLDVPTGSDGELAVRGPELFLGYSDEKLNESAFLQGRWFRTGDIGHLDSDGYLVITDRKKDVIIRGGENISSREVEELLFSHPDIVEAAVVAAPDQRMGEVVRAYIIPRAAKDVTLESVRAHFEAAGIARQKTPEQIMIVTELPRNSTGKVLKHELRAAARAEAKLGVS
jgi:acyl-CoA synthetase (AMP-forming)/AMP-acid ligase II